MSRSSRSAEERVRREASDWFALLRGEPTAAERATFENWLAVDPAHRLAYQRLHAQWERTIFLSDAPAVRARNLGRARPRALRLAGVGKIYAGLAIAAVLALALAFTVIGSTKHPTQSVSALAYNNRGSADRSVRLADGSRVMLAPGSRVGVAFHDGQRHVALLQGRARFTVAHDVSRPFAVVAGGGTIVALGTVFEVAIQDGQVRVVLHEGSVAVRGPASGNRDSPRETTVLAPGEATSFIGVPTKSTTISPKVSGVVMASFRHTRLAEAAATFGSGKRQAIRLAPDVTDLRVTGAFRRDDPEPFARAAAEIFGLALEREGDVWILSKK